jgi:TPR repeat protein
MLKSLLLIFLLLPASLFATDARLNDYPKASDWEIAAEAGDADAMYNLAVIYHKNIKDLEKAEYWYKRAYEKDKGSDTASNLGYLYDDLKQYGKAEKWYRIASEAGDKDGAFNLALLYNKTLRQPQKSLPYYEKAYSLGDTSAPLSLGVVYEKEFKNYEKAVEWYKKAYEMGNIEGANGLAYLCEHTLHDDACAEEWYLKAAKGNERKALGNLAKFYRKKGDNVKAGAYAISLIGNGYTKEKIFGYLQKWNLTKDQIRQAYELQKTFDIPKHFTGGID